MKVQGIEEQIEKAIQINSAWKRLLYDAVAAGCACVTSGQACDAELCDMGRWLDSPLFDAQLRESEEYQVVYLRHQEFHKSAGNILSYVERGMAYAAHFLLEGDFMERSDALVAALIQLKNVTVAPGERVGFEHDGYIKHDLVEMIPA